MEQSEKQLQSQGICRRVFYFITKALLAQASKPVTLGGPTQNKPGVDPLPDAPPSRYQTSPGDVSIDQMVSSRSTCSVLNPETVDQDADYESIILIQEVEVENVTSYSNNNTIEGANEFEGAMSSSASSHGGFGRKALRKKTVSINDEVQVIGARKKKRKVSQISKAGNDDEESRPLKSILRVGSIQT